jgi:Domain of unknown function (DUF1338)
MIPEGSTIRRLVTAMLGAERAGEALSAMAIDPRLASDSVAASRAEVAMALNLALFADLQTRVPTAAAYVAAVRAAGRKVCFDHGALRTIDGPSGALPSGTAAFARILEPLGYELAGTYPLPKLTMTGRAFVHRDLAESVPQFFVSELHVAQLPEAAQTAARRVFGNSRDPLGEAEWALLGQLARDGQCSLATAQAGLPGLVAAFGRHHDVPALADYEALRSVTAEGAWIATEGNAFNHATDRVPDVTALAGELRQRGFPLKPEVEVSANGRVRQTAFIAGKVLRPFRLSDGSLTEREVPGSFYEFISRDIDPATGCLDLTFDSGNATGIFAVTAAS